MMTAHIIFKHPNLPCSYPTVMFINGDSEGMKIGDVVAMWSSFGVLLLQQQTTAVSYVVCSISIYSRNWNGGPKEDDTFIIHPYCGVTKTNQPKPQ
eukprot:scaffold1521_cov271-Chaetoceros_neogracile.AAC.96